MNVIDFIKKYVATTEYIRIIKSFSILFEGSVKEFNNMDQFSKNVLLNEEVSIVAASEDGYLCISCR